MFKAEQMGVYIHWPFCKARCPYCDFNTYALKGDFDEYLWLQAYIRELGYYAALLPDKEVVSVFFGGGTPSLMSAGAVEALLERISRCWHVVDDVEISLEANPTSVENEKLKGFARAGVNRLSLGVQSFNDRDLVFLGREHSAQDAVRALDLAQEHFERYSFDLIYARPEQSVADWEAELSYALSFGASHMSLYQLTVEDGTPFAAQQARGAFKVPLEDKSAQFYNLTQDIMEAAGLGAYEVSNYAREWHKCRHNLVYWHMADYVGIGAGAHGRYILDGQKYATCAANKPQRWLSCVRERGVGYMGEPEALSASECFYESLLMGLRLTQGVSLARCEALSSVRSQDILDFSRIEIACEEGWLVYDKKRHHLSATREGILRLNALLGYIVR